MLWLLLAIVLLGGFIGQITERSSAGSERRWVLVVGAVILLLLSWLGPSKAQTTQHTFRDASGRSMGRSVTDTRGNTTFYNSLGQNTGRSSTQNGTTTIYNRLGQQQGTIRSNR